MPSSLNRGGKEYLFFGELVLYWSAFFLFAGQFTLLSLAEIMCWGTK